MIDCTKVTVCDCNQAGCDVCKWEKRLVGSARDGEDLDHLDYRGAEGALVVSTRGAGNLGDGHTDAATHQFLREQAAGEMERSNVVLAEHTFASKRDRAIYARHARGDSEKTIAAVFSRYDGRRKVSRYGRGVSVSAIHRAIGRIEREYAAAKERQPTPNQLASLVDACEPTTLILFFALLRKALEKPDEIRQLLVDADKIPALRGLIDPEPANDNHLARAL